MKRINFIYTLIVSTVFLTNCKKNEVPQEKLLNNNSSNTAVAGDEKWDVLGYGYDATGEYLHLNSVKTLPVIDVEKFDNENKGKIYMPTTTVSPQADYYYGSTASEFIKEINKQRKFDASASYGNKDSLKTGGMFFTASFSKEKSSESLKNTASRFSYAWYEETVNIKRIQFTDDIDVNILKNYTTDDFKTYINTKSPEEMIRLYGTHVLLSVDLGGRLVFSFAANIATETTQEKKVEKMQGGLGFFIKKFGINLGGNKTTEEMTKNFNESRERQLYLTYLGGTNSGRTISFDINGNSSESINLASWQQSISTKNCALTDIRKMVPLYHFVTDPTKRAQLKAAIEKYINDNQVIELGEVPIYGYYSTSGADHYYTHENSPTIGNGTFVNEGIAFYAFKERKENTVPIYVYGYEKARDHYFTTQNSPTINGGNFKNEGIAFYAYSSAGERRLPIFVYYYSRNTDHYYTTENSPTISGGNFKNEGVAFYGVKTY